MLYVPKVIIDAGLVSRSNSVNRSYKEAAISRVEKIRDDPDRKKRLAAAECVICYVPYGADRINGAASTPRQCGLCDAAINYRNTSIDILCLSCAKRNRLCKHCGADVDLKDRRKRYLFPHAG